MTQIQAHRGPDGEGYVYLDPAGKLQPLTVSAHDDRAARNEQGRYAVGLGHRRLAIIDLSMAGRQPMSIQGGRYWITYNGELYNYVEIREMLTRKGYHFQSTSDTEVLLASYAEWGEACLAHFNGMFAFALWDSVHGRLFCARDRFGEKPLYYTWDGERFAFASEIKGLLAACDRTAANERAVFQYLDGAVLDASDTTFFQGIQQLLPGHSVTVQEETCRVERYWALPDVPHDQKSPFEDAVERFEHLFREAIRLRLRSDVQVGSCLSGGLDSSSILCVARALRRHHAPFATFSSCFEDAAYDERPHILPVVAQTQSVASFAFPDPKDLETSAEKLVWQQDEPFGSTSIFAQWTVMRLAQQRGVKVLLDGQGADEQLGGYPRVFGAWFADLVRQGKFRAMMTELYAYHGLHQGLPKELFATFVRGVLPGAWVRMVRSRLTGSARWLARDFRHTWASRSEETWATERTLRGFEAELLTGNGLRALLHYEDRNSMAFGIEARLPFLDHRLVEFVYGLGPTYKMRAGWSKVLLREAMRGVLPETVRTRTDKMGFVTPEDRWFRSALQGFAREILSDQKTQGRGYLDTQAALRTFEAHVAGRTNISRTIWRWVNLELWCRQFVDERPCATFTS